MPKMLTSFEDRRRKMRVAERVGIELRLQAESVAVIIRRAALTDDPFHHVTGIQLETGECRFDRHLSKAVQFIHTGAPRQFARFRAENEVMVIPAAETELFFIAIDIAADRFRLPKIEGGPFHAGKRPVRQKFTVPDRHFISIYL